VVSTGAECDIAMLTVEDPSFFEGVTPVQVTRRYCMLVLYVCLCVYVCVSVCECVRVCVCV